MKDHTDISSLECPTCSAHGKMEDTGRSYERWFMKADKENGYERINIVILKCPVCDHYHALMFSWIKPFSSYSYDFIMKVLADHYGVFKGNKSKTAEHFGIDRRTVGRWAVRFEKSEAGMRPVLKDLDHKDIFDMKALLDCLRKPRALFAQFIRRFIIVHHHPWMASHIDFDISLWIGTFDLKINKVHSETS